MKRKRKRAHNSDKPPPPTAEREPCLAIYSSIFPPAASIALRAPLVTPIPCNVTAQVTSPDNMTLTRFTCKPIILASLRDCTDTTSPLTLDSSEVRTSARSIAFNEVKPNFGRRLYNGCWPPSNPGATLPPEREDKPL